MGGAWSTYEGEERCTQGFVGDTWGKEATWETQEKMGDNIKTDFQEVGWEHGLDRAGSG